MDNSCGLRHFRPQWLNKFATTRCFLVVYSLLGTTQAMAYMYFVATLTTMEKRFKIPSRTTGIVMSGNEISQILLSLSLAYYGGRGNRPRWIAWGVAISGLSCFILSVPHLAYGPGRDALALTLEYNDTTVYKSASNSAADSNTLCSGHNASDTCSDGEDGEYSMMPLVLIFLSQFVLGIGTTLYYALGQTYLDDNTKKTRTPFLLGCVMALRTIGPALGFVLGFACLSVYIDPNLTPMINKKDPRWLGAWWLGWIVLGTIMLVLALLLAMFPERLPSKKKRDARQVELNPFPDQPITKSFLAPVEPLLTKKPEGAGQESTAIVKPDQDFVSSLRGLLKNKLLMYNNVAGVFYILGASGYITFSTKYMETQYQKSAAGANIVAGVSGILAMVAGFMISGIVISKYKPRPRYLLGWNVVIGVVYVLAEISFIYLGCPDNGLHGLHNTNGQLELLSACNSNCGCANIKYSPVCSVDTAETYYSACHAGCQEFLIANTSTHKKAYGNCSCITLDNFVPGLPQLERSMSDGPCLLDCGRTFFWFLVITCTMHSLGSSGRIGNILVNYRCVDEKDKAFAQGLTLLFVSLFAFIPGPIMYGAIIDSACLVWDNSCGQRGHCWFYHKENFRLYLNSTAAVFTSVGVLLDVVVWLLGQDLNLYGEKETEPEGNSAGKERNNIATHHR